MKISIPALRSNSTLHSDGAQEAGGVRLATGTILLLLIVLAVALRIASAWWQGNVVEVLPGTYDQLSYDALARRVADGYGFSFANDHWPATRGGEPTAHWSFLYTLYVAAVYELFGFHPLIARLLQAVAVGVLHCWLIYRIGHRVFGPLVGLVAAGLSAVYIYFFYYAGALMTEPFYFVALLWTLDVTLRLAAYLRHARNQRSSTAYRWRLWVELGLALGIATLLRQSFGLFVPFLLAWLWWNGWRSADLDVPGHKEGQAEDTTQQNPIVRMVWGTLLAGCISAALIVPWTIRNYSAFGTFVPLNTNSGYVLFWGNHPIYGTNFIGILPDSGPSYFDLIPPELLSLNEAELDSALLQRGIQFIVDEPGRYVLLSLSRTREYLKFWPSAQSGLVSNIARVGSFGLYLPFMLYGVWIWFWVYRRRATVEMRNGVYLLLLFAVVYSGMHLLTWSLIRYRLPVDAVMICFAALGGVDGVGRFFPSRSMTKE